MKPQTASAWTGAIPACQVDFNKFNWKTEIKNHVANVNHYEVDSMPTVLIYRFNGQASGRFQVDFVPIPFLAAFTQGSPAPITGLTPKSVAHSNQPGTAIQGTSWEVDPSTNTVIANGQTANNPAQNKYGTNGTGNAGDLLCISTAKNYATPYIWDPIYTVSHSF